MSRRWPPVRDASCTGEKHQLINRETGGNSGLDTVGLLWLVINNKHQSVRVNQKKGKYWKIKYCELIEPKHQCNGREARPTWHRVPLRREQRSAVEQNAQQLHYEDGWCVGIRVRLWSSLPSLWHTAHICTALAIVYGYLWKPEWTTIWRQNCCHPELNRE